MRESDPEKDSGSETAWGLVSGLVQEMGSGREKGSGSARDSYSLLFRSKILSPSRDCRHLRLRHLLTS